MTCSCDFCSNLHRAQLMRSSNLLPRTLFTGVKNTNLWSIWQRSNRFLSTKFISEIVPNVDSIEIMLENRHMNNLVSLIAPDSLPMAVCVACVSSQLSARYILFASTSTTNHHCSSVRRLKERSEVRRARRPTELPLPPRVLSTKSYFVQAYRRFQNCRSSLERRIDELDEIDEFSPPLYEEGSSTGGFG
jgi:hypothetical protein